MEGFLKVWEKKQQRKIYINESIIVGAVLMMETKLS